jgi:bifunctional non-homologous end joining protein LigD
VSDPLAPYRRKRSAERTPEPVPETGPLPRGEDNTFVIQEHHARALDWDFRLERGGVLVSWALPRGLPTDPKRNHLAVHTEDHPLEYASFAGQIPAGEYGGGSVEIWDRGTYECETWADDGVKVVLRGQRSSGRFALIRTGGKNWLIHRMNGPTNEPAPTGATEPTGATGLIRPMLATLAELPADDSHYAYETKFDGVRAIAYIHNGQMKLLSRNDADVTDAYPELAGLAAAVGVEAVLDGEIVALDAAGRVSFEALQPRMHLRDRRQVARLAEQSPVSYRIFDLLRLDGRATTALPYTQRRELLQSLELDGPHWQAPPARTGGGAQALAEAVRDGNEGVVAKRLDSTYQPGRRSPAWLKIKHIRTQEVVVGGWRPGQGNRADTIGSLLLGIPVHNGLSYVGQVGTGFTREMLADLQRELGRARATSPFTGPLPAREAKDARWVTPRLVGEVAFTEWTRDGRLRHPAWRGLRSDKRPDEVVRE